MTPEEQQRWSWTVGNVYTCGRGGTRGAAAASHRSSSTRKGGGGRGGWVLSHGVHRSHNIVYHSRAGGAAEAGTARERGYKERRETDLVTGESRELELEGLRLGRPGSCYVGHYHRLAAIDRN